MKLLSEEARNAATAPVSAGSPMRPKGVVLPGPSPSPAQPPPPVQSCTPTLPGFTCGLDATLRVIAGKWKPLILYFLAQGGTTRYGELRRAVRDVSDKMLIQQLKELEADDLVKRTDHKEVPPRVDYSLSPLGRSLAEALVPLCSWGTEHMAEVTRVFARREAWNTEIRQTDRSD